MPKVEEDEVVPTVTITSSATNGTTADMKITLLGTCPVGTYLMRVLINGGEFSVGDAAGTTAVAGSGKPIGTCSKAGTFSITYPVPDPLVSRAITFKIKARLTDGRSSLEWAVRTVNYTALSVATPGFAIGSVGSTANSGILTGGAYRLYSIGGEAVGHSAGVPSSGAGIIRPGLYGVLLE